MTSNSGRAASDVLLLPLLPPLTAALLPSAWLSCCSWAASDCTAVSAWYLQNAQECAYCFLTHTDSSIRRESAQAADVPCAQEIANSAAALCTRTEVYQSRENRASYQSDVQLT